MPCVAGSHKGQLQVSVDRSADLKVHFIGRPFLHRQAFLLQLDIPVRGSGIGDLISRLAALKQCFRLRRAVYVMAPVLLARREVSVLDQFRSDISSGIIVSAFIRFFRLRFPCRRCNCHICLRFRIGLRTCLNLDHADIRYFNRMSRQFFRRSFLFCARFSKGKLECKRSRNILIFQLYDSAD